MARFPSPEWLAAFAHAFNASGDASAADKAWQGNMRIAVLADTPDQKSVYMFMRMEHGQCTDYQMMDGPNSQPIDLTLSAPLSIWRAVFEQKLHFLVAITRRKIQVEGNIVTLTRYIVQSSPKKWRAALLGIPVEFD